MRRAIGVTALMAYAILLGAPEVCAQLVVTGNANSVVTTFAEAAAYDPAHDCYLVANTVPSPHATFISRAGQPLAVVALDRRSGYASRVAYSPDVSDGQGGRGGFLVVWSVANDTRVFGQVVAFPGRLVGPAVPVFTGYPYTRPRPDLAYSPDDRVFLLVVAAGETKLVWLNLDGRSLGEAFLQTPPLVCVPEGCDWLKLTTLPRVFHYRCEGGDTEFTEFECNVDRVVWNPISREFGVSYNEQGQKVLARVGGDGTIRSRTDLEIGDRLGALAVNATTGNYLVIGAHEDNTTDGAEVDAAGNLVSRGVVTSDLYVSSSSWGLMALAYSPASGTFLLAGTGPRGNTNAGLMFELNQHGVPLSSAVAGQWPAIASHAVGGEWIVATLGGMNTAYKTFIVESVTPFGGSDARLSGCVTPDPFVAMGGGTCLNGGWLPRGLIGAAGAECTTPDPFRGIGIGTCISGGWVPFWIFAPRWWVQQCLSPKPGDGWYCLNGGWINGPLLDQYCLSGAPRAGCAYGAPPVSNQECLSPKPGIGWTCVNGGWLPPIASPANPLERTCSTPKPGPNWVCSPDGGWTPPNVDPIEPVCSGPDPFVAIGGGECIAEGWVPRRD